MNARRVLLALAASAGMAAAGCTLIPAPSGLVAYDAKGAPTKTAEVGVPVTFTCSGTDPLQIHLYMWDFGDGTVTEWDKVQIEHTYLKPGEYEVRTKERCPMVFGETCLMRTDWSMSFKILVRESVASTQRHNEARPEASETAGRTSASSSTKD
jgi:hypothetical protein